MSKPLVTVQVRELVEFALRRGDLGGERDFVGPRRALAGIRGHQKVQRSRPPGYEQEIAVRFDVEAEELTLRVQGRIDGVLASAEGVRIEEIKTVQRGWNGVAAPLHWAQVKCYGFLYTHDRSIETIDLRLVYLDLDTGKLTEFSDSFSSAQLAEFFRTTASVYLEWLAESRRWGEQRDASIRALPFPFAQYRAGQRSLAVAAYRTLARGGRLFLEAPTGTGKTLSVLFPAVKALGEGKIERLFYLTARTVGRAVAEKAVADLRRAGLRIRTLTLTAKEKICPQTVPACDAESCPLASGYYDRRHAAMRAALERETITRAVLEAISREHQVCPFELSLDLSMWVDAVIGDYNYLFDPRVYLRRHFANEARNYGFLIDEAHNLVDRAREMFSAELDSAEIREIRRAIKEALPRCARALSKLSSAWRKLGGAVSGESPGDPAESAAGQTPLLAWEGETTSVKAAAPGDEGPDPGARRAVRRFRDACATPDLPSEVLPIVEKALEETEAWLARNEPAEFREALLTFYFQLQAFWRTAELYDERYVTILEQGRGVRVRLFCLDPSYLLRQALARGKAAVFFSATLSPIDYYRDLLGGSAEDVVQRLPSPFPPENLAILVHDRIRTDFKTRAGTLGDVARAIAAFLEGRRGNYLVYFPSYAYLNAVYDQFYQIEPGVPVLVQRPGMTEPERDAFLAAFAADPAAEMEVLDGEDASPVKPPEKNGAGPASSSPGSPSEPQRDDPAPAELPRLVGFAVLGGIFGEGIDLVGDRLIGAAIVGVGLPQLCVERDLIRDYFQQKNGAGFEYAYTYPGMNRVLQAVGRVIRSETDRGAVLLIDARYAERRYRQLFPPWWHPQRVRSAEEILPALERFW